MADPYALVDPNAMEAPEVPEVGINVPSFQPPDEEMLAEMVNPPGSKDSGDIPASPPPAAAPAPAATPPPPAAAAPAAAPADDGAAKKKAEEEAAAAAAAAKKKAEEEAAAAAAKKKADEEAAAKKKADDEAAAKKKAAEEEAKKKAAAEEDKKKLDSAAAKAKEEADAKKKAEEEKLKAAAAAEAEKKKASEAQSNEAEKKKAEEAAKQAAEEKAKAEADAAAKKAKEEADAKAAAEAAAAAAAVAAAAAPTPTPPAPAAPATSPKLDAPAPLPTAVAPLPVSPAVAATQPAAQPMAPQQYPYPSSPMMPIQYYPPSYSAANDDLAKERAKEMEAALRADLLKAEQKLEDNSRTAREDMRRFESQIELLKDDLRKERDQRLASQAAAEAAAMKQSHDRQLESIADKFSKSLEQQHAVQLEKNAELEKKLLAKDSDIARRLEQMQNAKPAPAAAPAAAAATAAAAAPAAPENREALLADLKRDLLASGHIKKLEEEKESVRRECEEKLKAEREELGMRVTLLHHRMDLQHKQDIVEMLRREQAEREWEENLETDGFVELRKSERRGRKELAVNERRRDPQTRYPAVAGAAAAGQRGGGIAMPPSLADKALMSLMQKATPQTASNTVYTTKSFQKVFKVLEGCDLTHYAPVFAANEFDIQCLAGITDADLDAMGITTLGARKRLLAEAEKLRMGMMANPEEPEGQVVGGRALVDDEVTSQWCQERMAARNRASYSDVFSEVLWDDAWREATRLDASGAPCAAPGGHKGELLLQRLSGAPPPGAAFARQQPRSPTPAPPAPLDTWQTYTTDQGIPYYHNAVTGETLWHPPH